MNKPCLAKGTRDFGPEEMNKRKFIFSTIEKIFKNYAFEAIETPALENIETLTGKYGDEGDTLLFRILDSGDYLKTWKEKNLLDANSSELTPHIASRGLRYDLTVPFARFVAMNRHRISIPFRRYQMQPVWRADRPQKGRYREFWQLDADIIGSESLMNEADLMNIFHNAFNGLGIDKYQIHINNRKVLEGVADVLGAKESFSTLTVALDKFDKIGWEGVQNELLQKGFSNQQCDLLKPFLQSAPLSFEILAKWKAMLQVSPTGIKGIEELEDLCNYLFASDGLHHIHFDGTLARGLSYYTGCIFEVKVLDSGMGSIAAGGRYDNLTGIFGMPGLSGVGISFGADRIYDLMEAQNLFPSEITASKKILFCPLEEKSIAFCLQAAKILRENAIPCLVYPGAVKIKKQLDFANAIYAKYAVLVGENEINAGILSLKNLESGAQKSISIDDLIKELKHDF
jgi:histidyl-tRNA synthetase